MAWLPDRIRRIFGDDALDWWDRAYVVDWLVVVAMWMLSFIPDRLAVFERDFSLKDPLISHPHTKQQISGATNGTIALYVPMIIVALVGAIQRSFVRIHHGVLALSAGRGLSRLVTEFLKTYVGRLRPDFLARCKWKNAAEACTGKADNILDGRRSFPSGHSSTAWAGMFFLFLWIAGQTAAWSFRSRTPTSSLLGSRLLRLSVSLIPLFWAAWVAISRVEDYRHHKEDVIVGSLIGIASSAICYLIYWPDPFSSRSFTSTRTGNPRLLYLSQQSRPRTRLDDFELTSVDDDDEPV